MPYQVQQLLEGKGMPVCIKKDDTVAKALALMIEHDFSQLPVIFEHDGGQEQPEGMITYEGILRGIRNFKLGIHDLKVRDIMVDVKVFTAADDLFDILDSLKNTNAVLIMHDFAPEIVGIVTSYDTTEYFRNRTEDLMRVEDVEVIIKELIKEAYTSANGEIDKERLAQAIKQVSHRGQTDGPKTFEELTMGEYINLLTHPDTWDFFKSIFNLPKDNIKDLLSGIRNIRNSLAHFRGDLSAEDRDRLKFGADWLARCQEDYQARKDKESKARMMQEYQQSKEPIATIGKIDSTDFTVTESGGGRYAALADWLQSQPGRVSDASLTFNQVEEIIGVDLPASARTHRAWWANDSVGHSHSQLWLDAGWRRTSINLSEGRVTFSRMRDREKAYISFYSKLLDEFRKKSGIETKEISPDGASWIVLQSIPRGKSPSGSFAFAFSRGKRLRVELYLDLYDQGQTKEVFDKLNAQRESLEAQIGSPIEWERLDNRRASRLALYREGEITDAKNHAELRKWAVESMTKFYNVLVEPAEKAIAEVKSNQVN